MSDTDTPTAPAPPPPDGLVKLDAKGRRSSTGRCDGAGRRLWKQVLGDGKYILRGDELRYLEDACKLADRIALLEEQASGAATTVKGSQGQQVINPILAEDRQCRLALAQELSKIKFPDDPADSSDASPRSTGARAAANSRWGKRE